MIIDTRGEESKFITMKQNERNVRKTIVDLASSYRQERLSSRRIGIRRVWSSKRKWRLLSRLLNSSIDDMEKFFAVGTVWGVNHPVFNMYLTRYANEKRFSVAFGSSSRCKWCTCKFKGCTWRLQWNFTTTSLPPSWRIGGKTCLNHSEECQLHSSSFMENANTSINFRRFRRQITICIVQVSHLRSPSCLNPHL